MTDFQQSYSLAEMLVRMAWGALFGAWVVMAWQAWAKRRATKLPPHPDEQADRARRQEKVLASRRMEVLQGGVIHGPKGAGPAPKTLEISTGGYRPGPRRGLHDNGPPMTPVRQHGKRKA
jgi:hypothetical protein